MSRRSASSYRAPWWLPGGHAQTIYARLFARCPNVPYTREVWTTPDGDRIAIDRVVPAGAIGPDAPLLVHFHGLEGDSTSHYAKALMSAVGERGWRGAVVHFRGCGGMRNDRPRAYHSGDSMELDWILSRFRAESGSVPLFAVGVSLGGNVLVKWLGEQGEQARRVLNAAAAVCAPLDLAAGGRALERGFSRVYSRYFLQSLRPKALEMLERYPGLFDARRIRRSRTLRHFDDAVTAPMFGFADAEDYWARASAKALIGHVRVPTLILNAGNDPFQPADVLPRVAGDSLAQIEITPEGGHVGYVSGRFPGHVRWLPARIIEFLHERSSDQ